MQFRFDLVPEAVIVAGLVMNLLDHYLPFIAFRKIGIPALAFAQQAKDPIG